MYYKLQPFPCFSVHIRLSAALQQLLCRSIVQFAFIFYSNLQCFVVLCCAFIPETPEVLIRPKK